MSQRVSPTDVKAIFETTVDLSAFIMAADLLIDELMTDAGYSEAHLKEIARWLSAHYACTLDPRLLSEKVAGADVKYQTKVGDGLEASSYGQQVLTLDTKGILKSIIGKKAAIIEAIPS